MRVIQVPVGDMQANAFIVFKDSSKEAFVVDPGADIEKICARLEYEGISEVTHILLTHGHFDHTGAVEGLVKQTGATVCMSRKDVKRAITELGYRYSPPKGALFIKEGDKIKVGSLEFEVIETPGHSEGSVTFRCEDALFTGDTLFRDSCGRTDLPGCNGADMMKSLKKLCELPGDYEVYPGHMEATSLERERRCNYFMQQAAQG